MKYCYGRNVKDALVKIGKIYTAEEHHIKKEHIDYSIIEIINTLVKHGHTAYVVGGAIRDLLSHTQPKDFDIVTNAHPHQIKTYFRSSQIVGKRFPIVLVRGKRYRDFVEVSTFRSNDADNLTTQTTSNNTSQKKSKRKSIALAVQNTTFGSIAEDVMRRDFTCNALYYDVHKEQILDFVEGVQHLQEKKLVAVRTEFEEDPIRMIRAIKYAHKVHLSIPFLLRKKIIKNAPLLKTVSHSRVGDEIIKILISGVSMNIMQDLFSYSLLKYMLPNVSDWYHKREQEKKAFFNHLQEADNRTNESHTRIRGLQMLIQAFVMVYIKEHNIPHHSRTQLTTSEVGQIMNHTKKWIQPITPPNAEIQKALISILSEEQLLSSQTRAKLSNFFSRPRR